MINCNLKALTIKTIILVITEYNSSELYGKKFRTVQSVDSIGIENVTIVPDWYLL